MIETVQSLILKELRAHNNLSQRKAAEICGVHRRTWENWESGIIKPSDLKLMAIIHILEPDGSEDIATLKERLTAPEELSESS